MTKGQLSYDGVESPQAHAVNRFINRFLRGIPFQVDNECASTRFENTIHLFERPHWSAEILKGSTAKEEIKRLGLEGHVRSITLPEININSLFHCVSPSYFNECVADID